MNRDKEMEKDRYDVRAQIQIKKGSVLMNDELLGAQAVSLPLRAPYLYYEQQIRTHIKSGDKVLEIGCGTGLHTGTVLKCGACVTATDISPHALEVLQQRYGNNLDQLNTKVLDMEHLSLISDVFDAVVSAGSLSYGDNHRVMEEIFKVLKPGGVFLCVDSLNHNPIYNLNRWFHFLRGERTQSTLLRMPKIDTIELYKRKFGLVHTKFFGTISWLIPVLEKMIGSTGMARLSDTVDSFVGVRRSAFKFVMVATKVINE